MDKIKKYARSSKSDSTSPKGSSSNPYTQEGTEKGTQF